MRFIAISIVLTRFILSVFFYVCYHIYDPWMLPAYNALIRVLNSLLMWERDPNKYTTFMPAHTRAYVCAFVLAGMPLYGKWLSEYLLIKVIVGWCELSTILAYWNGNLSYFCDASTLHYFQRSHACRSCWT